MTNFKAFLGKLFDNPTKKGDTSSAFSKFFREAKSREKKKVFLDVAKKASKEQMDVIKSVRLARTQVQR
jgi:hypothetical protein